MAHLQSTEFHRYLPQDRGPWSSHGFRPWLMIVAMTLVLAATPFLRAQSSKPTDYDVKAAYLYNFGHFVEWPVNVTTAKNESFTVCVLGQDPFGPVLDAALVGETIAGKRVAAKRISTPQESGNCQILFMASAEEGRIKQIMETLNKQAVLTVSDMPRFSQRGGMIQFVLEGNRVRFEVNLTAVQQAGLSLSSDLLKVAAAVRRNSPSGD
jgi:YfiR/HmsC-like